MADDRIEIQVVLDDGQIREGFARIKKEADGAANEASKSFRKFDAEVSRSIRNIGATLIAGFSIAGITAFTRRSIEEFRNFEKALVGVGKTTTLTQNQLQGFGQEINKLAQNIPVSQNELLELAQAAGQLGVDGTDNLLNFTETAAKLQAATDLAGAEGVKSLVRILTVTKESVDTIDELGSVIVRLGNNFAATESEIVNVTTEIARATGVFDVSAAQAAAFATAVKATGGEAATAGTTFSTAFIKINEAISTNSDKLKDFARLSGKTAKQFAKDFREDAAGAFDDFLRGLSKVEKSKVPIFLTELGLGEKRALRTLQPLIDNYAEFSRALTTAEDELKVNTALNEEAAKAFNTLDGEIQRVENAFKAFFTSAGNFLQPTFKFIADQLVLITGFWKGFIDTVTGSTVDAQIKNERENIEELTESITKLKEKRDALAAGAAGDDTPSGFLGLSGSQQSQAALEELDKQIKLQEGILAGSEANLTRLENLKTDQKSSGTGGTLTAGDDGGVPTPPLEAEKSAFDEITAGFADNFAFINSEAEGVTTNLQKVQQQGLKNLRKIGGQFAKGFASSFAAIGQAAVQGENVFKAFGQAILGVLGDVAINAGLQFILMGLAGFNPGQVALGAALVTLGGAMKALSGGKGGVGTAEAGGAGNVSNVESDTDFGIGDDEELERMTSVEINVDGTVLDPIRVGEQIAELLSDVTNSNDIKVNV